MGVSTVVYIILGLFLGLIVPVAGYYMRETARELRDNSHATTDLALAVARIEERQRAHEDTLRRHEHLLERLSVH